MADEPYFTVEEFRTAYPTELVNVAKFTEAKLEGARSFAEQWFEAAAKVAYVRRSVTETVTATGSRRLFLTRWAEVGRPTEVKVGGVALTAGELADLVVRKYGVLERLALWPDGTDVDVTYPHGYDGLDVGPHGELVKGAVMLLALEHLAPRTVSSRATSVSTDLGAFRISQADKTGKTGIPEVDAVIGLVGADKPPTG